MRRNTLLCFRAPCLRTERYGVTVRSILEYMAQYSVAARISVAYDT